MVDIVNIDCLLASQNRESYCSYCGHGNDIATNSNSTGNSCKFCGHKGDRGSSRNREGDFYDDSYNSYNKDFKDKDYNEDEEKYSDRSFDLKRSKSDEADRKDRNIYTLNLRNVEFYKDQNLSENTINKGINPYPEDDWEEYGEGSSYNRGSPFNGEQQRSGGFQLRLGKNLLGEEDHEYDEDSYNDYSDEDNYPNEDWKDTDFGESEEDVEENEGEEENNSEEQLPNEIQSGEMPLATITELPNAFPLPEVPDMPQQLPIGITQQDMLAPLPTLDYQQLQQGQMLPDYTYPTTLDSQNLLQYQDPVLSQNGLYGPNGMQSMQGELNGQQYSNHLDPQVDEAAVVNETLEYLKSVGVLNEQILAKIRAGMIMGVCIACPSDRGVQYVYQIGAQNGGGLCEQHLQAVYEGQLSRNNNGNSSGGLGGAIERGLRSAFGIDNDRGEIIGRNGIGYSGSGNGYGNGNNGSSYGNDSLSSISNGSGSEEGGGQGLKGAAMSLVSKLAGGGGLGSLFGGGNSELNSSSEVTSSTGVNGVPGVSAVDGTSAIAMAANSDQMVLNALGQLVPIGSFSDQSAPFGYVRNPDGSLRPATSLQEALMAASAASGNITAVGTVGTVGTTGVNGVPGVSAVDGTSTIATAANSNQMVLNALGQLVPAGSFSDPNAPYGYVKNPDGTLRPAASLEEAVAAASAVAAGEQEGQPGQQRME